jgi:hypothetical protein
MILLILWKILLVTCMVKVSGENLVKECLTLIAMLSHLLHSMGKKVFCMHGFFN